MKFIPKALVSFVAVSCACIFSVFTLAVEIEPPRTELIIDPGDSASATLRVINSESFPVTVRPEITVYTRNDEEGYPIIEDLVPDDPMNITTWLEFPKENISLEANADKLVNFKINVPDDATPGGRYAAIRYLPVDASVKTRPAAPSLILVVTGEETHHCETLGFGLYNDRLIGDRDPVFAVSFRNVGNMHEKPTGSITIFDVNGRQIKSIAKYQDPDTGKLVIADEIPINLAGGNVLPDSSRTFLVSWNKNVRSGEYVARLDLEFHEGEAIKDAVSFGIFERLDLESFTVSQMTKSTDFKLAVTNSGNVYEKLEGKIEILNDAEKVIDTVKIPANSKYIEPGSTISTTIPWLDKEPPRGDYTARLAVTYGFSDTPLNGAVDFTSNYIDCLRYCMIAGLIITVLALAAFILWRRDQRLEERLRGR